jgi:hypothetical protein
LGKKFFAFLLVVLMIVALVPAQTFAATWVDVATFAQLKSAIESATTTHIRLQTNIDFPSSGVIINTAKPELVIDGNGYTWTDANSISSNNTLRYTKKGNLKNITIQNMRIIGRNYHGMITVDDSTSFSDVTITFDNINYTGPGLSWGKKSNYVIRDSTIMLVPSSPSAAHQVVSCLRVRLEGNVNITKNAPTSSADLFWITGSNGGVTIATDANVNISNNQLSPSKTCSSGMVQYFCSNIYFIFEDFSRFTYVGNNLFQQGDSIDTLTVGKNAEVNITLNGEFYFSYGAFHCRGKMLVDENATFRVFAFKNKDEQPLIQLRGKGECTFNNPREVFIYNSSTNKCNAGLAMGPNGCDVKFIFNNIMEVSYWKFNTAPPTALPAPTYDWKNATGYPFSAMERHLISTCKAATATDYTGTTPWNTTTATVNNINVVRIWGGVR